MSLFNQWNDLLHGQTKGTIDAFWEKYSDTETKIYKHILSHKDEHLKGRVGDLVDMFDVDKVIFVGFLDGVSSSLNNEGPELKKVDLDTEIDLDIDFDKLYYNMHKADADYLWSLEEWNDVLSEERRQEIYDEFRRSRTVHVVKRPGRNDPCHCGSGKKYKNCCMKKDQEEDRKSMTQS